jgi:hypothetical protein
VIVAMLFSFAVVRFVGLGTGNHGLYITGGICLVAAMALKQLGVKLAKLSPGAI